MNFVKTSLKHRQVTFTVLLLMFAFGAYSLVTMPRREDPKITVPAGLVIAYFPGADAAQVEDQVTARLEEYLFQFEEVQKGKTYSITSDGVERSMCGFRIRSGNPTYSGASCVTS